MSLSRQSLSCTYFRTWLVRVITSWIGMTWEQGWTRWDELSRIPCGRHFSCQHIRLSIQCRARHSNLKNNDCQSNYLWRQCSTITIRPFYTASTTEIHPECFCQPGNVCGHTGAVQYGDTCLLLELNLQDSSRVRQTQREWQPSSSVPVWHTQQVDHITSLRHRELT